MSAKSKPVIDRLNHLLGSANVFTRKVRHYHWSVKGRAFFTLHAEFDKLYSQWADLADEIAERIVALDGKPLATQAEDVKQSGLKEDPEFPDADTMVKNLVADMETLRTAIHESYEIAEKADDRTTEDLLDEIRDALDGKLWMFKAYLG